MISSPLPRRIAGETDKTEHKQSDGISGAAPSLRPIRLGAKVSAPSPQAMMAA